MGKKGTTVTTSCKKPEIILVFSIVDATLVKKGTTITTSCNDRNRKVRQQSKKSGKISGKTSGRAVKQPGKPVVQVIHFMHYIQGKGATKASYSEKSTTK